MRDRYHSPATNPSPPRRRDGPGHSRPGRDGGRAKDGEHGPTVLYGWHPVVEALANAKRRCLRLLATENAARRLAETLPQLPIAPELVRPGEIDRLLAPDALHQGLYLEAEPLPAPSLETMAEEGITNGVILVLDQITDPHNVGAIVRSAAAFGVAAIVTTARHSPAATGTLAKSASGGLEHVPFVTVRNLAGALQTLAERGFQLIGLDSDGAVPLAAVAMRAPLALVVGAEGKGLRQLTRQRCHTLARLDMPGAIKSLNVSNAAAIALYAVTTRLKSAGFSGDGLSAA
jgi:23S rRNA (guanosine2251-2'-O)-methyltransferase